MCPSVMMHKETVVYVYKGTLSSHEKNSYATTWLELEIIVLSWNTLSTDKQVPYDLTCMWKPKKLNL
jgi:hypothetical protein